MGCRDYNINLTLENADRKIYLIVSSKSDYSFPMGFIINYFLMEGFIYEEKTEYIYVNSHTYDVFSSWM